VIGNYIRVMLFIYILSKTFFNSPYTTYCVMI
jgi:hypothetical protein